MNYYLYQEEKDNLKDVDYCTTRIRLEVADPEKIDDAAIKNQFRAE